MTTYAQRPAVKLPTEGLKPTRKGHAFVKWVTTTDHKRIGYMYLITTFAWFLIAGFLALLLRSELARPGLQFLSNEQYNQIFTMHGNDNKWDYGVENFNGHVVLSLLWEFW